MVRLGLDVGTIGLAALLAGVAGAAPALADGTTTAAAPIGTPMERTWPALPTDHALSLEDQITDHLTELGNRLGRHLDLLSHDYFALRVDGRAQRARIRIGGGNPHYLSFRIDSDWHFTDGQAHINARLAVGVAGHLLDLKLPEMDVIPDSYHGQQMVEVNVPVLDRHF